MAIGLVLAEDDGVGMLETLRACRVFPAIRCRVALATRWPFVLPGGSEGIENGGIVGRLPMWVSEDVEAPGSCAR